MTSPSNILCLPVLAISFFSGLALGYIIGRIPKRKALEWLALPGAAIFSTAVVMTEMTLYMLLLSGIIVLGMIMSLALLVASGRGLFEKYQR